MEQESISKKIAIIGAGPAGCICAKFLKDAGFDVFIFEKGKVLQTLLPTGGGKCNLAHAQNDYKELAKNYPRGEKFLYSVFSRFGTYETIEFFKSIGVETYVRADNRIFPNSNSSADVREKFIRALKGAKFLNEKVIKIIPVSRDIKPLDENRNELPVQDVKYSIITDKNNYVFDVVVVATGGHSGVQLLNNLNLNIQKQTPSLVGLMTKVDYSDLAGVCLRNVKCEKYCGDFLFTHKGVSGPLIYTLSSVFARKTFPYNLSFKFIDYVNMQEFLDKNSNKEIKNLISQFVPKTFANRLLTELNINPDVKCHKIDGKTRDKIYQTLLNYEITLTGKVPDGEIVSCGGVDLKEIKPKNMEAKRYQNLYFCGEILDIDGFCGGFNLQNCWSTGYIVAQSIIKNGL